MKRDALYIRVSTEEQARHGFSLGEQRADLERYARSKGYIIYDVYADEGITARKAVHRRKELQRLLADVEAGHIDVVCFKCLDRWFRNIADYYAVDKVLTRCGVSWECTQEEYNTLESNGRLMLNLKLSLAQHESDQTSDRIKYINQGKLRRREEVTGKHPYGYELKDKKLAIVDAERPIVEFIFQQLLAGSSTHSIAGKVLEAFGVALPARKVWRILRNPTYKGERYEIPDFCPAIIPPTDFDAVQELLGRNKQPSRTGIPYYFTGQVVCPSCGNILVVNCGKSKKTGEYTRPLYVCGNRYITGKPAGSEGACQFGGGVSESVIERYLLDNIGHLLADYYAEVSAATQGKQADNKAHIKHLEQKLSRLKDLYVDGLIDKDTYKRDYSPLMVQLEEAARQDASRPKDMPTAVKLVMQDNNFAATYEKLDRQHRRELWQSIISRIEITRRPEQKGQRYKEFKITFR